MMSAWRITIRMVSSGLRALGRTVVDLVYPPLCPGCESAVLEPDVTGVCMPLCQICEARLAPLVEPFCHTCGQSYAAGGEQSFRCSNCSGRTFDFEFAIAPYQARGLLRDMVHRYKFGKVMALRVPLGQLMARVFADPRLSGQDWVLVPVPIHARRQRDRTFNQATELARVLAKQRNLPLLPALRRTQYTPPQSRLNRQERLENLSAAIAPAPESIGGIAGRAVLLVDDIFTTGSTGQACAKVLMQNGARKVVVITLARG